MIAVTAATATALALVAVPAGAAMAAPAAKACDTRNNNTIAKLTECVTAAGVNEHLEALQAIADANGGTRVAGLSGYEASVDYVTGVLEAAGWNVTIDEFPFTYVGPAELEQTAPVTADYATGAFTGTGYGEVVGNVIPVDLQLATPAATTSGCEPGDFAGLDFSGENDIALIQRGFCNFSFKALNAEAAGAEAVVIFNQGTPDRLDLIVGTLGGPSVVDIPVVGGSYANGVALSQAGSTARVFVPAPEQRPQKNVIAELPGRNTQNVVMAGAHLDSVAAGPGINDNGSGSAALLELAQNLSKLKPENTIRLAWWGAEEAGLLGSAAYVDELSQAEKDRIALYLNFDMIASPNYVFMIYDSDQSGFPAPVAIPPGSVEIEDLFERYFTTAGVPYDDAQFTARSDYQAFVLAGIASGGLFTGAEVPKTAAEAAIWGGTAGEWLDHCYHQACDTIDNIDMHALDVNSDAIALAVLAYSYSTELVNGVVGKSIPGGLNLAEPAGPAIPVAAAAGGGGLSHDHDHALAAD
ncbi:M20/M25/M40 family metallo-hydrolase [Microbacterium sp. SS28]|uniref:M20/M25/M40 family metallo-hydrolase n=1 Tax=Microbacterium sp. SS28 TaxID=2919948 RepID=UPI001FAA73AF|nr:M20/M25/M40 family metallo-hydrolase [Microbacterium sp. SS28]